MAKYLLHSMKHFEIIVDQILKRLQPRSIIEIGAEYGGSTKILAEYAHENNSSLIVIDPSPKSEFPELLNSFKDSVRFVRELSLTALKSVQGEIYFIDGDHNYYTVFNELKLIFSENPDAWVVLHDVGVPCARRDQYYAPLTIPEEHRLEYTYDYGVDLETGELRYKGGFWGAGEFAIAKVQDTPKNGVLTAIEDILEEHTGLHYVSTPLIFGLGLILPAQHRGFADNLFSPYTGELFTDLERNRLDLYNQCLRSDRLLRGSLVRRLMNRILDYISPV